MCTTECKYCDTIVSYKTYANFIIFCPNCKRYIFLECEYGYGPVTPCNIFLGNKKIGLVDEDDTNKYYLEYGSEKIMLNKTYLKALKESVEIVREKMHPNKYKKDSELLIVKKLGGGVCFYGDWIGKSGLNYRRIEKYSFDGEILEIDFDYDEKVLVFEPLGIKNTINEFGIFDAKKVRWIRYYKEGYERKVNKISYELRDGKVYKINNQGEEILERKRPYYAFYF